MIFGVHFLSFMFHLLAVSASRVRIQSQVEAAMPWTPAKSSLWLAITGVAYHGQGLPWQVKCNIIILMYR